MAGAAAAGGGRTGRQQRGLFAPQDSRGVPTPPPRQCQSRSNLPGAPHRRPSPTTQEQLSATDCIPARRGGDILAAVAMATSSPVHPHMVPGPEPRGSWPRDALPPPAASAARLQPRRMRNAGTHVCELELMEMDRMFRLHRFTWGLVVFISGLEAERERKG